MPPARVEIAHHHLKRFPTRLEQFGIETDNFRHPPHADTLVKTGNGDFVSFIKNSRNRRAVLFRHRNRQRIAFQRIDRNIDNPFQHRRGIRTKRHHIGIGFDNLFAALDAINLLTIAQQLIDRGVKAKLNARLLRHLRQTLGKELAVAGFVIRQTQAAGQFVRHFRQRRLDFRQSTGFQQLIRHTGVFQHGDVARGVLILLRGTEQLQRPALPPFILDTGRRT